MREFGPNAQLRKSASGKVMLLIKKQKRKQKTSSTGNTASVLFTSEGLYFFLLKCTYLHIPASILHKK